MQHVINKLTVELACADEEQAFKTREAFLHDVYDEMVSVIEMCCDRVSNDDQLTQIEKLEVNLQAFRNKFFEKKQYVGLFEAAFREALEKKVTSGATIQTAQRSRIDILFRFLETGLLPWWADERTADIAAWCDEIMQGAGAEVFLSRLLEVKQKPVIWRRISAQLPASFGAFVIDRIPELKAMRTKIKTLHERAVGEITERPLNEITERADADRNRDQMISDMLLENALEIFQEKTASVGNLPERLAAKVWPEATTGNLPENYRHFIKQDREESVLKDTSEDNIEETLDAQEEKIQTGHAGIVLLAAFLNKLFTGLKLWEDNHWSGDGSRYRAAYLLNYLATGKDTAFEYQLALEKVVCGIPLYETLDRKFILSSEEKQEADDLLAAVIGHWAALKNTSVNGLRGAFLQREGLMLKKYNGWLLQVERKTLDVLLEQLPWGYATVSLPWNKYLMYTEW